ncbi:hypothetical protein ACJX0J_011120 [Zea mays]
MCRFTFVWHVLRDCFTLQLYSSCIISSLVQILLTPIVIVDRTPPVVLWMNVIERAGLQDRLKREFSILFVSCSCLFFYGNWQEDGMEGFKYFENKLVGGILGVHTQDRLHSA